MSTYTKRTTSRFQSKLLWWIWMMKVKALLRRRRRFSFRKWRESGAYSKWKNKIPGNPGKPVLDVPGNPGKPVLDVPGNPGKP